MKHRHGWVALCLGLLTWASLAVGHRSVGYVRDEGIYFAASRSYAHWCGELVRRPGVALSAAQRDRWFAVNHEHPALLKTLAGLTAAALARPPAPASLAPREDGPGGWLPWLPEGAAMRLPAQALAGLAVGLLYAVGAGMGGGLAGLLAAGAFILLPRVAFHAGLHAFDVPVAVAALVVVLVYRQALRSPRWGLALGPVLGLAIAIKHNALFFGPMLALHYYASLALERWRGRRPIARGQWLPLPMVSMACLAPAVALLLWPWLWTDPVGRFAEYLAFHREHAWYNMEFLGRTYNQPPMPMTYPLVMTWATVPTVLLALAGLGAVLGCAADLRRRSGGPTSVGGVAVGEAGAPLDRAGRFATPLPGPGRDGLLFTLFAVVPIAIISLPNTPIFGGTKHWITAYPFFALLAARAWSTLWRAGRVGRARRWAPVVLALCLAPAAIATVDGHPYNLSQYAPAVGGARGAARLGLNRGFWGHAIVPLLPSLEARIAPATRLYLHDLHDLALLQYRREGRWPEAIHAVPMSRAQAGLIFHERHMATWEIELWERLGTTAPVEVLDLDGVPLTSVYGPAGRPARAKP